MTTPKKNDTGKTVDILMSVKNGTIQFRGIPCKEGEELPYVQILVNKDEQRLFLREADGKSKTAIQLKTRPILPDILYIEHCGLFLNYMYALADWHRGLDYLLSGKYKQHVCGLGWVFRLSQGKAMLTSPKEPVLLPGKNPDGWEKVDIIEMTSTEITPADDKAPDQPPMNTEANTEPHSACWNASFGIPAREHSAFTQVQQIGGYDFPGEELQPDTRQAAAETDLPELNERMG